jgi:ABC-type phosphate transport system substrate-binding protein
MHPQVTITIQGGGSSVGITSANDGTVDIGAASRELKPDEPALVKHLLASDGIAIVTDPALLLADEPTGNLDTKTSREIMDLVTALNRDQGITVIMVTHETDIAACAGRIVRFLDGRVESDVPHREAA